MIKDDGMRDETYNSALVSPKTDVTTYESKRSTSYEADKLNYRFKQISPRIVERNYFFNRLSNFSRSKSLPMKTNFRVKCKIKIVSSSVLQRKEGTVVPMESN